jgi:hypothetical protein
MAVRPAAIGSGSDWKPARSDGGEDGKSDTPRGLGEMGYEEGEEEGELLLGPGVKVAHEGSKASWLRFGSFSVSHS